MSPFHSGLRRRFRLNRRLNRSAAGLQVGRGAGPAACSCSLPMPWLNVTLHSMRKRIKVLVLFSLGCIAVVLALVPSEREPTYQGRTLSEWIQQAGPPWDRSATRTALLRDALLHMGTNVFPTLVKWVSYQPPSWRKSLNPLFARYPALRRSKVMDSLFYTAERRSEQARAAFWALTTNGAPALPALACLSANTNNPDASMFASICAFYILLDANSNSAFLTTALTYPDPFIRRAATNALNNLALPMMK